jgi:3-oxoadipate enol-lactonase
LPPARLVRLPGRGVTVVRDWAGPPGAPVVFLVHGVTLTGDVNWFGAVRRLGQRFRVISFDQRGHGGAFDPGGGFRLEHCADDVAALAGALGIEKFIAVGYSMGGLVVQLLWRRHTHLVDGLVLCATARNFRGSPEERLLALTIPTVAAIVAVTLPLQWVGAQVLGAGLLGHVRDPAARRWAEREMGRTRLPTAVAAVQAVSQFTSHDWIGGVDVPTAVVIPTRDHLVPPSRQHRLARAIPGARVFEVDGDHGVFLDSPEAFGSIVLAACGSVERSAAGGAAARIGGTARDEESPIAAAASSLS